MVVLHLTKFNHVSMSPQTLWLLFKVSNAFRLIFAEKVNRVCVWLFGSFGGCTVSKEEGRGRLAWGVWSREEQ